MSQERFSNLTLLNTHKDRTDKLFLDNVENKFADRNDNRKRNFGALKKTTRFHDNKQLNRAKVIMLPFITESVKCAWLHSFSCHHLVC